MKTTVIYHSADFDGLFCREIARKFLPEAELIGWDFGDAPIHLPAEGTIYVMDLPVDRVFGFQYKIREGSGATEIHFQKGADPKFLIKASPFDFMDRVIWIDHHKSSIETHPAHIPGYRIDGVAACRLAWQWFRLECHDYPLNAGKDGQNQLPTKQDFIDRTVPEPLAVLLAGEYDVWDKRDPRAELFQFGLRSQELTPDWWKTLLSLPTPENQDGVNTVSTLLFDGQKLKFARDQEYRDVIAQQGFDLNWKDLCFLACNSHELDIRSQLFADGIKANHQALLGFTFSGRDWRVSLYRIDGKEADILAIAKAYGGGGHAGACGFRVQKLPFLDL